MLENVGQKIEIADYTCHIFSKGTDIPYRVIYWLMGAHEADFLHKMKEYLDRNAERSSWRLVAVEISDWNQQLSPWQAPAVFGGETFAGRGRHTLQVLQDKMIPRIEADLVDNTPQNRIIGGYSLAGLFSLWAFYESGSFGSVASCSGSLWYPGWVEYLKQHTAPENSMVYLSLGTKEEKTKNPVMAQVGEGTRKTYQMLCRDMQITQKILEWNPGGHFTRPLERMAGGFLWLLNQGKK